MPPTIQSLPPEILLLIGAHFTHHKRNTDLTSLALVSHTWRIIAQEWLLKAPRFNLTYIDAYIWHLNHHPHLHAQIHSLEIFSASEGRIARNEHGVPKREYIATRAPTYWNLDFVAKCTKVIERHAADKNCARRWTAALHDDCVSALFGVLVCMLPNLSELRLGNTWLMDFPILSFILSPDITFVSPAEWRHRFLVGVLPSKLRVLDVPADMTSSFFTSQANTVFDFRSFQDLREVGISMRALWWCPTRRQRRPPDPREIFPQGLEVLRISEATEYTPSVLDNVCKAKIGGYFEKLMRVEVYYMEYRDAVLGDYSKTPRALHPILHVQRMCRDAQIALYLHFPAWVQRTWEIGGSPWRLREEKEVFNTALRRGFARVMGPFGVIEEIFEEFEAEWDSDGDVIMVR
jgi:hypothetical protein